jgi:ethanolamine utilization cobalamin adenosyltransferase
MNSAAISARIRRLERLSLGVAREIQLVAQTDIFLYVERREYLQALNRMTAGFEAARVALAKARQRFSNH